MPRQVTVKSSFSEKTITALRREHISGDFPNDMQEGELLHLRDKNGKFTATAYYGIQNRAIGWVISKRQLDAIDADFFAHKFENAFAKRLPLLRNKKTNVFRIFNGEGDGVGGLTIDYYDANILINYYSEGIISYRKQIIEALKRTAEFATITEKNRSQKLVETESSKRGDFVVLENGVKCRVNLESGGMTGIFMDQREVRQVIRRSYAKNRDVLNLFSYSALFSVFAVLGGAKSTTNVDIAKRSHEIAEANYALNGISTASHKFLTDDVFEFLIRAAKQNLKYDLIIIDPPSFSTSNGVAFSTEKELGKLIDAALAVSSKNAVLVVSTNNSKISKEQFSKLVGKKIKIREEFSLPADYRINRDLPESNYLKVAIGTPL